MKTSNDILENIRAQALAVQANEKQELAQLPPWQRLRRCEDRIKLMSTVPSSSVSEYTTSGKAGSKSPPAQQVPVFRDEFARVLAAVEELEDAVRAETGGGVRKAFATLRGEDKDAELLKWAGTQSFVVAVRAPWLGSTPKTIESARKRLGVRPWNGLALDAPRQSKKAA